MVRCEPILSIFLKILHLITKLGICLHDKLVKHLVLFVRIHVLLQINYLHNFLLKLRVILNHIFLLVQVLASGLHQVFNRLAELHLESLEVVFHLYQLFHLEISILNLIRLIMESVSTRHTRPIIHKLKIIFVIVPKRIIIFDLVILDLFSDRCINFEILAELCNILF
jgi:hypothetical protein